MGVAVQSADETAVVLQAPLEPNINHRETVFGGSASALAILAGWSLLHVRLRAEGLMGRLVIQRSTMDYLRPMTGEFQARAVLQTPERWPQFTRMLARRGKARIAVSAVLEHAGEVAGRFAGEFVALGADQIMERTLGAARRGLALATTEPARERTRDAAVRGCSAAGGFRSASPVSVASHGDGPLRHCDLPVRRHQPGSSIE